MVKPAKAMDLCQNLKMNQFSEEKLQKNHFPDESWEKRMSYINARLIMNYS